MQGFCAVTVTFLSPFLFYVMYSILACIAYSMPFLFFSTALEPILGSLQPSSLPKEPSLVVCLEARLRALATTTCMPVSLPRQL
jgi:hypothetical protein